MRVIIKLILLSGILIYINNIAYCKSYSGPSALIMEAMNNRKEMQIIDEQYKLTRLRILNSARILGPSVIMQYKESEGAAIEADYRAKTYNVKLNQSVFTGGKKWYTLQREMSSMEILEGKRRKTTQEIKFDVVKAYYTMLLNREKVKNFEEIIPVIKKEKEVEEKKYKAEIITRVEYLEIVNMLEEITIQKEMNEAEYELALIDLQAKVFENLDTPFEIDESTILEKDEDIMNLSLNQYKKIGLKNRPEIQSLQAVYDQSIYTEKTVKAERWPNISFDASVGKGGEAYVDQELVLATEWSVMANLQWLFWGSTLSGKTGTKKTEPSQILDTSVRTKTVDRIVQLSVLDRLDFFYQAQERRVSIEQAIKEIEDMEKKIQLEVTKSYRTLAISKDTIKMAINKLELLEKQLTIVEKRKFLGEATAKDHISALQKMVSGKNSLMESISKYNIGLASLKLSIGMDVFPVRGE